MAVQLGMLGRRRSPFGCRRKRQQRCPDSAADLDHSPARDICHGDHRPRVRSPDSKAGSQRICSRWRKALERCSGKHLLEFERCDLLNMCMACTTRGWLVLNVGIVAQRASTREISRRSIGAKARSVSSAPKQSCRERRVAPSATSSRRDSRPLDTVTDCPANQRHEMPTAPKAPAINTVSPAWILAASTRPDHAAR
jgi:hypothetical protein